jgi:hypothetical protein
MRNIFEVNCLFEQSGIGLNRDEIYWYDIVRFYRYVFLFLWRKQGLDFR